MLRSTICFLLLTTSAQAQCGGDFRSFLDGIRTEARQEGLPPEAINAFLSGAAQDNSVLRADRSQGVFQKPFLEFSRALISQNRIDNGRANLGRYASVFDQIEADLGVPRGVLTAFWAFETDYGGFQGNFNTRNALLTLAHDCRRPELFRPQVLAAIELTARGGMDPASTTGAWAGEIGMVQMLPKDILENGRDGDGDGRVLLKTSAPDALVSGAYDGASNMTEQLSALAAAAAAGTPCSQSLLDKFFAQWKDDKLVMLKWLQLYTGSDAEGNLANVQRLVAEGPVYDINNPNSNYALLGGFASSAVNFHAADGSGYKFHGEMIQRLDGINAQVAARMVGPFIKFRKYDEARQAMMRAQLEMLRDTPGLSANTLELVTKSLDG